MRAKPKTKFGHMVDGKDISIARLSRDCHVARPSIAAMYYGKAKGIQFETLEKLCQYFKMDAGTMIGLINSKTTLLPEGNRSA